MNGAVDQLLARLRDEDAVLVRVESTQGSAPREAGTWMAVWAEGLTATIGGGQLEFQATQEARELLAGSRAIDGIQRYPLGPSLGQCCGGVVFLSFRRVSAADIPELRRALVERFYDGTDVSVVCRRSGGSVNIGRWPFRRWSCKSNAALEIITGANKAASGCAASTPSNAPRPSPFRQN